MIENLPDTNVGNIEYIRRQDAMQIAFKSPFFSDALMEEIKALPSADVVQVCRCRNCKYFYEDIGICDNPDALVYPTADGFCSYGEREE